MVREIIGLVSIVAGLLLLCVSFYLFLRRNRRHAGASPSPRALIILIYGLLFFAIGIIIERTAPAIHEPSLADTSRTDSVATPSKIPDAVIKREISEPKAAQSVLRERLKRQEIKQRKTLSPVLQQVKPASPPKTPEPTIEDKIYETVDAFLRRIEEFLDRYAVPVTIEPAEVPTFVIEPIFIDDTAADISPKHFPLLNEAARRIKQHPEIATIEVQSYTDGEGPEVYNYLITQSRANAVRDYLIARGIKPERLVAKGYGATKPLTLEIDTAKTSLNRRIEFVPLVSIQSQGKR